MTGDAAKLKELLTQQNSRNKKQEFDYDNKQLLDQLRAKLDELVRVKAAIASANTEVYAKIFRRAGLKGLVSVLSGLDTKAGTFRESSGYGGQVIEIQYVAQIPKVEVDRLVKDLKNEIVRLQDELDKFNFTHDVRL